MAVTLEDLRRYVGAVSTNDDDLLTNALAAASGWIDDRIYVDSVDDPDIDQARLLLASRLYSRRQSPEGTSGFQGSDIVIRIASNDPDLRALMERHNDTSQSEQGIGIG